MAAAPLSLPNLDGESVDLASLRGKAVVVNFWASWCAPCVHELPALGRVAEALADDGVRFLAIAIAQRAEEIVIFERDTLDRPIPFPAFLDSDASVNEAWKGRSLPTSFLIGPDGRVHARVHGAWHWDSAARRSRLRELAATR